MIIDKSAKKASSGIWNLPAYLRNVIMEPLIQDKVRLFWTDRRTQSEIVRDRNQSSPVNGL